jgi:thioredoxin reductase (NADPH)
MTLAEAGARVTIAMRRPPRDFQSHLRPFIVRDLTIMADEKRLTLVSGVEVAEVTPTHVRLRPSGYVASGVEEKDPPPDPLCSPPAPNDFVFALLGHTADPLFAHLGLPLAPDGLPVYDEETAETPVSGLFVAGALSRANIILESRRRAVEIVARISERLKA